MFHIVFNADENYIKYLSVLLVNIIQNTDKTKIFRDYIGGGVLTQKLQEKDEEEGYIFHILSDTLSQECQDKLQALQEQLSLIYPCEIRIHIVDDSIFAHFPKWGFEKQKNYIAYYRILLSRFVPEEIERCLYIDVDALILCDIREIFAMDLGEYIAAAVNSPLPKGANARIEPFILQSVSKNGEGFDMRKNLSCYFCSGFMLFNMSLYRANHIETQCFEFLQHYIPQCPDQDALNVALNEKILILPEEYGFLLGHIYNKGFEAYTQILPNAKIVHYNNYAKPWRTPAQNIQSHSKFVLFYPYYQRWWDIASQAPTFNKELKRIKIMHYNPLAFCVALIVFVFKPVEKNFIRPFVRKIRVKINPKKYALKK
ncbi:glycosyltransferase family 8 protein [Helicobacter typhlonius]|uniref:glycosyltransferase family 8 protein n=1 Tax=Helicobacter typhlonius TaxID=76936 RepID=UPI002FE1E9ED